MRAHMPYLQFWKGNWRVRKPVPKSVQALIGRGQYLTRGLGTADRAEADRLAIPILAEFQDIIGRAERGDWPPFDPEWGDFLAYKWRGWAKRNNPERVEAGSGDPVFANEDEFRASVTRYVAEHWPAIKPGTKSFETVRGFARGECTIEKSNRTSAIANPIANLVSYEAPKPSGSPYRFSELIDDWAL